MSDATRRKIMLAILRIRKGRTHIVGKDSKLNVSTVAREAGVSDSLIYKSIYCDILESIRSERERESRRPIDSVHEDLEKKQVLVSELRRELKDLKKDYELLAQRNQILEMENQSLRSDEGRKIVSNLEEYRRRNQEK